jgi:hypothetical protein
MVEGGNLRREKWGQVEMGEGKNGKRGKWNRRKSVNGHRFPVPILVEGVIRRLRRGISPEEGKALSPHHIWMFIPSARPSIRRATSVGGGYARTDVLTYGMNIHM